MGRPAESKHRKRKKGRPSLLDLQKRSLRLQQQHHLLQNPNPNPNPTPPNPYLRFPPRRRDPAGDGGGEDEDEEGAGRKEKRLNLVLRLPDSPGSDGDGRRRGGKRRIADVAAAEKTESGKSKAGAGDPARGELPSDAENGTPLPDKKLLVFILDRLQKKDTYGVFSEPVDPEELPDYHDIIENPMDFGTIRKKLSRGAYANLEQFEKDVFLISLNAMRYNASDTVYFRQARSIQELAKKDFQNLRQESEEDEPEQKPARRGRPPTKNAFKKPVGRPTSERASNNSDAVLPKNVTLSQSSVDATRNSVYSDKPGLSGLSNKVFQIPQTSENCRWFGYQKAERNEEFPGSTMREMATRHGKNDVAEENRRNTYTHSSVDSFGWEHSILTTFDGEKKELVPVGLHIGYAYARSLSRFAAALGPVAWEIAAKRIEKALPPGMNFGRGWIDEQDVPPQLHHPRLPSVSSSDPCPTASPSSMMPSAERGLGKSSPSLNRPSSDKSHLAQITPVPSAMHPISKKSCSPSDAAYGSAIASRAKSTMDADDNNMLSVSSQPHENSFAESTVKGEDSTSGLSAPPLGPFIRPAKSTESVPTDSLVTARQLPETVSANSSVLTRSASVGHAELERARFSSPCAVNSFHSFFHPPGNSDQGMERAKLQRLGNATVSAHPTANHVEADLRQLGKPGASSSRSCISHPVASGQSDMEKSNNLDVADAGNDSVHLDPAATNLIEPEISKVGYTDTVNNRKNFIHSAAPSQSINERTEIDNSNDLHHAKDLSHHIPSSHIESGMPKPGNPRLFRVTGSFTDPTATGNETADKARVGGNTNTANSCRNLPELPQDPHGSWRQVTVLQTSDSTPDLNVRFQSPTSPPPGMVVDSQHPDLMLQL